MSKPLSYTRIPDAEEEDRPLDESFTSQRITSSKQTHYAHTDYPTFKRRWFIGSGIAFLFVCSVYYLISYVGTTIFAQTITIYGTSLPQFISNRAMMPLNAKEMTAFSGISFGSVSFGNVQHKCRNKQDLKFPPNGEKFFKGCSDFVDSSPALLTVNQAKTYQTIVGFGGAFTEATALNFKKLPYKSQQKLIEMYFGKTGIGLTMGRISINSCDFSEKSYNFDNIKDDLALEYFDTEVTHDNAFIIPMIRLAMEASSRRINIVASPWSPPAWMKKTHNGSQTMTSSAAPNGLSDDPAIRKAWALYIAKFIKAYKYKGVPIWAITPQNEPEFAAPWEACAYDAIGEKNFINNYLGPTLRQWHPEVKLLAYDHNKDHLREWAETIMEQNTGRGMGYVDGMAFHWYSDFDRVSDGTYGYNEINATHHFAPEKLLIATEGCSCPGVDIDNWLRAERLGHDIIFDLKHHTQGWIDWNLLLDSTGGPNHKGNLCDAPLIANSDHSDFHIQPKYYYFGHIAKFVTPGAVRIESNIVGNYEFRDIDPNVQGNLEIGLFSCEKSTRQVFRWTKDGDRIQLATSGDNSGSNSLDPKDDYTHKKIKFCISKGENNRKGYLRLSDCADTDPAIHFLQITQNDDGQLVDMESSLCVTVADGVREEGALLVLESCVKAQSEMFIRGASDGHQLFDVNKYTGEIQARSVQSGTNGGLCLTAGWPFLTAVAFKKEKGIVVIIMNEAIVPTTILLLDQSRHNKPIGFAIDANSMQTVVY